MKSGNEIGILSEEGYEKFKKQNPDFKDDGDDTTPVVHLSWFKSVFLLC